MKMNKAIAGLCLSALLLPTQVFADALGFYVGGRYWQATSEGGFSSNASIEDLQFDDEGQTSFYAAFEHPVPLIPNARIARSQLAMSGITNFTDTYFFDGVGYSGSVATTVDLTHTDYILYYEIFDTDIFTFDIGINAKRVEGDLSFNEANIGKTTESVAGFVPMAYAAAKIGLPLTGLGVFAEASVLSTSHKIYDATAGISYQVIDNLAVDMTLQVGYRTISLQLDDLDDIHSDLTFEGVFAGVELHF